MAAPMQVELGFVEKAEEFLLKSRFFPSKVGGRPAWLSLESLPSIEELSCSECSQPTSFLLQISSPMPQKLETFHRTIFIFVCSNANCCKPNSNKNFHVFRSQLPRQNKFYNAEPAQEIPVENEIDASKYNKLCLVCGCLGPKTCGKCHNVNYCSKEHQALHWKKGHKTSCSSSKDEAVNVSKFDCLFLEMELVTEAENYQPEDEIEKTDEEKMKEYAEYLKTENIVQTCGEMSEAELQKMASKENENDKQLQKFKKRISLEPEQVLRYDKGKEPLWIAHDPKPDAIPDCKCGATRQFEFQVLPNLLSHMNVDKVGVSIDWGTLCVYTCSESCSIGNTYSREYLFKQDIV